MISTSLLVLSVVSLGLVLVFWFGIFVLRAQAYRDRRSKAITQKEFAERIVRNEKMGTYISILGFGSYLFALEFNAHEMPILFGPLLALILAEAYRDFTKRKRGVL